MARGVSKKARKPRGNWTPEAEKILLDSLTNSHKDGLGGDSNFKPEAYSRASSELREAGFNLDNEQCKGRFKRFKHSWATLNYLRKLSGFGWDDDKKMVTAPDEVWHRLLHNERTGRRVKNYNELVWFKMHPFPEYDTLSLLCGGSTATGEYTFASINGSQAAGAYDTQLDDATVNSLGAEEEGGSGVGDAASPDDKDEPGGDKEKDLGQKIQQSSNLMRKRVAEPSTPPASPPLTKRKRSSGSAQLREDVHELTSAAKAVIQSLAPPPTSSSAGSEMDLVTPRRRRCYTLLSEHNLSLSSNAKARRLFRDPDVAIEFLGFAQGEEEA